MPYLALLVFFMVEYIRPTAFVPALIPLKLNLTVLAAVTFAGFFLTRQVTNGDVLKERNTRIILFLLGLVLISIVTADSSLKAFEVMKQVLGYVLVYWAIAKHITGVPHIKGLFKAMVFVHPIIAVLTPQLLTSAERQVIASGSFLGDPNDFALSVNVAIPLCLFLLLDSQKVLQRLVYAGLLLFLVLAVAMTQSRGGTLALVCVGFYYWIKSDRKVLTASLGCVAVAMVLALAPARYFERLNSISTYEEDTSAMGRVHAWQAGVRMALANPLLGVGAGHFPANHVKYVPGGEEYRWRTAHSIYFLALGELGFPGLAVLLTFIGSNILVNRRLLSEIRGRAGPSSTEARLVTCLSVSLVAYAIAGAFLSAVYYPHMFVLGGLLVAARRMVRERSAAAQVAVATPAPVPAVRRWAPRPAVAPQPRLSARFRTLSTHPSSISDDRG